MGSLQLSNILLQKRQVYLLLFLNCLRCPAQTSHRSDSGHGWTALAHFCTGVGPLSDSTNLIRCPDPTALGSQLSPCTTGSLGSCVNRDSGARRDRRSLLVAALFALLFSPLKIQLWPREYLAQSKAEECLQLLAILISAKQCSFLYQPQAHALHYTAGREWQSGLSGLQR